MTAPLPLTQRQRALLLHVAAGGTNAAIGHAMGIHAYTVAGRLGRIYAALGVPDRASALALAIYRGEITPADLACIYGDR
ncbi:response regulator transcription factor [Streptomyces sp. NBC_00566]|uniref:response regulator transcription factor n=1 Tax=Streptomyces sp. NBC_00566 TaxID=2975778 RepID=UPI002E8067F4|nr:LuxR C-terminal-related transcriptional regulator [Streptomyces sp. NBC_00566]WUB88237.1 LuxR C-terminal-related transcriptional regulator [Streptomyces sp. NBC_00566]